MFTIFGAAILVMVIVYIAMAIMVGVAAALLDIFTLLGIILVAVLWPVAVPLACLIWLLQLIF